MKVRKGFVSNSSSSSFIISGAYNIDEITIGIQKLLDAYNYIYNCEKEIDDIMVIYNCSGFTEEEKEYYGVSDHDVIGKIRIDSTMDNSIPYFIQEAIENGYSAKRYHWG